MRATVNRCMLLLSAPVYKFRAGVSVSIGQPSTHTQSERKGVLVGKVIALSLL